MDYPSALGPASLPAVFSDRRLIGVSGVDADQVEQAIAFLGSAGFAPHCLARLGHPYDVESVRARGGLIVHLEKSPRPRFARNQSSAGADIRVGDCVIVGVASPGEWLPRLLTAVSGAVLAP